MKYLLIALLFSSSVYAAQEPKPKFPDTPHEKGAYDLSEVGKKEEPLMVEDESIDYFAAIACYQTA